MRFEMTDMNLIMDAVTEAKCAYFALLLDKFSMESFQLADDIPKL